MSDPNKPHQDGRSLMDLGRLRIDPSGWGAWYSPAGSQLTYYALGRDDWAPIAVACSYMIDPEWVTSSLQHLWDLPPQAEWAISWREANAKPIGSFVNILEDDEEIRSGPSGMFPVDLGKRFQEMDQTCLPRLSLGNLVSSPGDSAYRALPIMRELKALRPTLRQEFFKVCCQWFLDRGVQLDPDRLEVHVPGYEALYHLSRFDP